MTMARANCRAVNGATALQHVAIAQMDVPVVGAADGDCIGHPAPLAKESMPETTLTDRALIRFRARTFAHFSTGW